MEKPSTPSASLLSSFEHLFVREHAKDEIQHVLLALQRNEPIAPLLHTASGSFSTLFLPFHIGDEEVRAFAESRPRLRAFCTLAGTIESLTDTLSLEGEEPPSETKAKLLPLLEQFLTMLPPVEEFRSWVGREA